MWPSLSFCWITIAIVFLVLSCDAKLRVDPLVNTKLGLIRGVRATDGDYSMFMGIPYAQVNDSNPFGAAIPQGKFDDTFEANNDSAICPQIDEFNIDDDNTIIGGLDCLHLNVYVPTAADSRNRVPVLVWIYGGGFTVGYGGRYVHGPKYLVRHDIILVTFNYRVGPYGFMCLDTPEQPGNAGLKDQQLALKWIKDNIEAFGGDPNKITVFGESAGGESVDFHMLFSEEKLFDQAILQSCTSLTPLFRAPEKNSPFMLSEFMGFRANSLSEALIFLAAADPHQVVNAATQLGVVFRPCLEKKIDGVQSILSENWIKSQMPKVKNMPILIGFNSQEKIASYATKPPSFFDDNVNLIRDKLKLGFDVENPEFDGMPEIMQRFYMGDEEISYETRYEIIDFESDFTYAHPVHRSISKYLANDAGNIFLYVFSYSGGRNFGKRSHNVTEGGASHADEYGYLFDVSYYKEIPTSEDQLIIDRITTLWANFAKFGNPTPDTTTLLPVKWSPITNNSLQYYLNITTEMRLGTRPFYRRMAFWDLFYKINDKLQIIYPGIE